LSSSVIAAVCGLAFLEGINFSICLNFNKSGAEALAVFLAIAVVGESILLEAAWVVNPWATPAVLPFAVGATKAFFNRELAMPAVSGWSAKGLQVARLASFFFKLEAFGVTIISA